MLFGGSPLAHPHQAGRRWWKFMGVFTFREAENGYQVWDQACGVMVTGEVSRPES